MGLRIFTVVVTAALTGALVVHGHVSDSIAPPVPEMTADRQGEQFLQYRAAVATYMQQNPTFTGTVSPQSLKNLGFQFAADFLSLAGNAITATGTNGRIATSYATLVMGAGSSAMRKSNNDGSIGVASGSNWTSLASHTTSPLATSVPNGAVVSVTQIGN